MTDDAVTGTVNQIKKVLKRAFKGKTYSILTNPE